MVVIRVYLVPKGYEDYVCESVTIRPTLGGHEAVVNGGEFDGKIIPHATGAKWLRNRKAI